MAVYKLRLAQCTITDHNTLVCAHMYYRYLNKNDSSVVCYIQQAIQTEQSMVFQHGDFLALDIFSCALTAHHTLSSVIKLELAGASWSGISSMRRLRKLDVCSAECQQLQCIITTDTVLCNLVHARCTQGMCSLEH